MANVKELQIAGTNYDIVGKAVVNQNNNGNLRYWTGTKAEYDAIENKDSTTIYNITDDAEPADAANTSLTNLSVVGRAKFTAKANTSLDNLSSAGQAVLDNKASTSMDNINTLGRQNIKDIVADTYETKADAGENYKTLCDTRTNCITEIPQDIKLELNNGTLTLKAGSKVYVPNGPGVFDVVTTTSDIAISAVANRKTMIFYRNGSFQRMNVESCYSGTTAPSLSGTTLAVWYDTTNNVIKYTSDSGATWVADNMSLPVCIATETTSGFTSIDQVFNGLGYIGSTLYALPGVKGLASNGRNADGTPKSLEFTLSTVTTATLTHWSNNPINVQLFISIWQESVISLSWWSDSDCFVSDTLLDSEYNHIYVPSKNEYWYSAGTPINYTKAVECFCAQFWIDSSDKISGLRPAYTYQPLDSCGPIDYVVAWKTPSSSDPTWYRLYKSGWVEQGGYDYVASPVRHHYATVTFLIPMANTNFMTTVTPRRISGNYQMCIGTINVTTTNMVVSAYGISDTDRSEYVFWKVEGQSAL